MTPDPNTQLAEQVAELKKELDFVNGLCKQTRDAHSQITDHYLERIAALKGELAEARRALENLAGYAATVRVDKSRMITRDGTRFAIQTHDWCMGLFEQVEKAKAALAGAEGKA